MRSSMFAVMLLVLVGVSASGCANGYGQNKRCHPGYWGRTVCYDAAGMRSEYEHQEYEHETASKRDERWERNDTIERVKWRENEDMEAGADHAKRMMALCRQGKIDEIPHEMDKRRCRQLLKPEPKPEPKPKPKR